MVSFPSPLGVTVKLSKLELKLTEQLAVTAPVVKVLPDKLPPHELLAIVAV
jgi:hypothetical protein